MACALHLLQTMSALMKSQNFTPVKSCVVKLLVKAGGARGLVNYAQKLVHHATGDTHMTNQPGGALVSLMWNALPNFC